MQTYRNYNVIIVSAGNECPRPVPPEQIAIQNISCIPQKLTIFCIAIRALTSTKETAHIIITSQTPIRGQSTICNEIVVLLQPYAPAFTHIAIAYTTSKSNNNNNSNAITGLYPGFELFYFYNWTRIGKTEGSRARRPGHSAECEPIPICIHITGDGFARHSAAGCAVNRNYLNLFKKIKTKSVDINPAVLLSSRFALRFRVSKLHYRTEQWSKWPGSNIVMVCGGATISKATFSLLEIYTFSSRGFRVSTHVFLHSHTLKQARRGLSHTTLLQCYKFGEFVISLLTPLLKINGTTIRI